MLKINNELTEACFDTKGAELRSLKYAGQEYLWQADPKYWAKSSPVLFPMVGSLIQDKYYHEGKSYTLPRHGFARDLQFDVLDHTDNQIVFSLNDAEETRNVFPFRFELMIIYTLVNHTFECRYEVRNTDENDILFSLGAHPAFKLPVYKDSNFEDYSLFFEHDEFLKIYPLVGNGILALESDILSLANGSLALSKPMFYKDALVIKDLKSDKIVLRHKDETVFGFTFEGFSHFGVWSAKDADFVCLEPWCGVADTTGGSQLLIEKEGIICLSTNEDWSKSWQVKFK